MDLHEMANYGMIPTYEEFRDGILKLIDEGKISRKDAALVIPELRESDDERRRKNCIYFLELQKRHHADTSEIDECIAYLEKQKDLKYSEEQMEDIRQYAYNKGIVDAEEKQKEQQPSTPEDIAAAYQMGLAKGRNEQKPAEWSEKDEKMLRNVYESLYAYQCDIRAGIMDKNSRELLDDVEKEKQWLKSLRPQSYWKPNEEQMEALNDCVSEAMGIHNASMGGYDAYPKLQSLYNDLKKLM